MRCCAGLKEEALWRRLKVTTASWIATLLFVVALLLLRLLVLLVASLLLVIQLRRWYGCCW